MTTFTVPRTERPISEGMFADLGIPTVTFTATPDGGQQVDVPSTITPALVIACRVRLMSPIQETLLSAAGIRLTSTGMVIDSDLNLAGTLTTLRQVSFSGDVVGGSIAIAQSTAADVTQEFAGTTFPAGWVYVKDQDAGDASAFGSTVPGLAAMSVITTGVPAGTIGSALRVDFGPAVAAGNLYAKETAFLQSNNAQSADNQIEVRFQQTITTSEGERTTLAYCRANGTNSLTWTGLRMVVNGSAVLLENVTNGSAQTVLTVSNACPLAAMWYRARMRAVGGRVEVTVWQDGAAIPAPTVGTAATNIAPGFTGIGFDRYPFLYGALGVDCWIDSWRQITIAAGFRVDPDGTAQVSRVLAPTLPVYANNAAAITGGSAVGAFYRNGADPDHLCIVH